MASDPRLVNVAALPHGADGSSNIPHFDGPPRLPLPCSGPLPQPPRETRGATKQWSEGDRAPALPSDNFRRVLGHFVTGVTVVTGAHRGDPAGFTCQSFSSVSLDPPLVLLCPGRTSTSWPKVSASGRFAVNVLAQGQAAVARQFAASGGDKFAGIPWRAGPRTGAPILAGIVAWLECEIAAVHESGDHWIVVARVLALDAVDREPLTFFRGQLAGLGASDKEGGAEQCRKQ